MTYVFELSTEIGISNPARQLEILSPVFEHHFSFVLLDAEGDSDPEKVRLLKNSIEL